MANGMLTFAVSASTASAARQVSGGLPDSATDSPPSSRTTRIRRWYSTFAVVSDATVKLPAGPRARR